MPTQAQIYENDCQDIAALPVTDVALLDSLPFADTSASNVMVKATIQRLLKLNNICQGRLTLTSNTPENIGNNWTAKTVLYYTPYKGNFVSTYDGTRWELNQFSELSLDISAYTADKNYDIWIYSASGGNSPTLDSTIWTNDTTRATALALQDGIYVKSGDETRRYLGTIRITGTTGQCEDSYNNRFVWNYYNRIKEHGWSHNTNTYWSDAYTAWREANAGSGQVRFKFVVGVANEVRIGIFGFGYCGTPASIACYTYACMDSAAGGSPYRGNYRYNGSYLYAGWLLQGDTYYLVTAVGYHFVTQCENSSGATSTVYGSGSTTDPGNMGGLIIEG